MGKGNKDEPLMKMPLMGKGGKPEPAMKSMPMSKMPMNSMPAMKGMPGGKGAGPPGLEGTSPKAAGPPGMEGTSPKGAGPPGMEATSPQYGMGGMTGMLSMLPGSDRSSPSGQPGFKVSAIPFKAPPAIGKGAGGDADNDLDMIAGMPVLKWPGLVDMADTASDENETALDTISELPPWRATSTDEPPAKRGKGNFVKAGSDSIPTKSGQPPPTKHPGLAPVAGGMSKSGQPGFKSRPPGPPPKSSSFGWDYNSPPPLDEDWLAKQEEFRKAEEERRKKEAEEEAERQRLEEERRKIQQAEWEAEQKRRKEEWEAEQKRRKEEEERQREEEEKRRQQAELTAEVLQSELAELVAAAEVLSTGAHERAERIEEKDNKKTKEADVVEKLSDDEVIRIAGEFESLVTDTKSAVKMCADFMAQKHLALQGVKDSTKERAAMYRNKLREITRSIEVNVAKVGQRKRKAIASREAEIKRQAAIKAEEQQKALFNQYDKDGDGKLSAKEVVAFVKGEYDFDFPLEKAQETLKQNQLKCPDGASYDKFPQLKMLVGIARNEEMARRRKKEKEEQERLAKIDKERRYKLGVEQKKKIPDGVKVVVEAMGGIESEVVKAEQKARPLNNLRGKHWNMAVEKMENMADEVDAAVDAAKDFLAAAMEQATSLCGIPNADLEEEAKKEATLQSRTLTFKLQYLEKRLTLVAASSKGARDRVILHNKKQQLMREAALAAMNAAQSQQSQTHAMRTPPLQVQPQPMLGQLGQVVPPPGPLRTLPMQGQLLQPPPGPLQPPPMEGQPPPMEGQPTQDQ